MLWYYDNVEKPHDDCDHKLNRYMLLVVPYRKSIISNRNYQVEKFQLLFQGLFHL